MFAHLYDEKKAVDAATYLLQLSGSGMSSGKLNGLLYLAERESFQRFAEPLTGDGLVIVNKAPMLAATSEYLSGQVLGWEDRISRTAGGELSAIFPIGSEMAEAYFALSTRLSSADIETLDAVWERFGTCSDVKLADFIHSRCLEWTDDSGEPSEVNHLRLLRALGYPPEAVEELLDRLEEEDRVNAALMLAA